MGNVPVLRVSIPWVRRWLLRTTAVLPSAKGEAPLQPCFSEQYPQVPGARSPLAKYNGRAGQLRVKHLRHLETAGALHHKPNRQVSFIRMRSALLVAALALVLAASWPGKAAAQDATDQGSASVNKLLCMAEMVSEIETRCEDVAWTASELHAGSRAWRTLTEHVTT